MTKSNLPFASEFSPSQIDLSTLLELCKLNSGDKAALEAEILARFFEGKGGGSESNRRKLAMNCRLGLKAYGIINDACNFTGFGDTLYSIRDNDDMLYSALAKHILLNLNGMGFIQCIRDMNLAGETVTLDSLRAACAQRGLFFPSGGKHPSMMRLWLSKAGVFVGNRWDIDEARLESLLGQQDHMDHLRGLSELQRYFLLALLNTGSLEMQKASGIVHLAETTYGIHFPEKSLPKMCLNGLEESGYIIVERTTKGRGAKSPLVAPTQKADREIVIPFLNQLSKQTDPKLVALLRKPLHDILDEMRSSNRYIAGLALEALAFKLMRAIGMDYVATRLRAEKSGGAEVDLIFESSRLVYSRWQIQCKNTNRVSLEDVAKEVGLTHMLKSNVIVVVSTGVVSRSAKRYSSSVMSNSNLCIVFIEGVDIRRIAEEPAAIVDVLCKQARATMTLKQLSKETIENE